MNDPHYIDAFGRGCCPLCRGSVIGEPETLVSYWHPIEVCRDALVVRLRAVEAAHARLVATIEATT